MILSIPKHILQARGIKVIGVREAISLPNGYIVQEDLRIVSPLVQLWVFHILSRSMVHVAMHDTRQQQQCQKKFFVKLV